MHLETHETPYFQFQGYRFATWFGTRGRLPQLWGQAVTRLRGDDALVVLMDCQSGPLGMVRTMEQQALFSALASLADIATALAIPVLLVTTPGPGVANEVVPELARVALGARHIARHRTSVWEDMAFREAVKETGRTTLIIGGAGTDTAVALLALAARDAGLNCAVAVDACGTVSEVAERAAWMRLASSGVALVSWTGLATELADTVTGPQSVAAQAIVRAHFANLPRTIPMHRE